MDSIVQFGGLASGLDTNAIIDGLLGVKRIPIQRLQARITDTNNMKSRISTIVDRMKTLQTAAADLHRHTDIFLSTSTVADEDVVTATATAGTNLGSFDVVVSDLAKAGRHLSDGFAAKDQDGLFGTGTFTISVAGSDYDIDVGADDTLEDVASLINNSDAPVSAGIIFDGSEYFLQVTGDETGLANEISFTENPGETTLAFGIVEAAQDASFTVGGIPMTRSTNIVTEAISGVTLTLRDEGETTVRIEQDDNALAKKMQTFVDAYNAVNSALNTELSFNEGNNQPLLGDSTLRSLKTAFTSILQNVSENVPEAFNSFSMIGVQGKTFVAGASIDGSIEFDRTTFLEAFAENPTAIADLLAGDQDSGAGGLLDLVTDLVTNYTRSIDGILTTKLDSLDTQIDNYDDSIGKLERHIDSYETLLRKQFTAMEQAVSLLQNQGSALMGLSNLSRQQS